MTQLDYASKAPARTSLIRIAVAFLQFNAAIFAMLTGGVCWYTLAYVLMSLLRTRNYDSDWIFFIQASAPLFMTSSILFVLCGMFRRTL